MSGTRTKRLKRGDCVVFKAILQFPLHIPAQHQKTEAHRAHCQTLRHQLHRLLCRLTQSMSFMTPVKAHLQKKTEGSNDTAPHDIASEHQHATHHTWQVELLPENDTFPAGYPNGDLDLLPLRGAELHNHGGCDPCAWFWGKKGCCNGRDCCFCHVSLHAALSKNSTSNRKHRKRAAEAHRAANPTDSSWAWARDLGPGPGPDAQHLQGVQGSRAENAQILGSSRATSSDAQSSAANARPHYRHGEAARPQGIFSIPRGAFSM